ncbi:carbonyl reductase 1 [Nannizzia gypsea CBS 118893]|uniref:Carbonyl reductase 1 n=1 Tax=Arthroderma gypseum (strain ATCC MYA-4604 / CBS 118893) TaxID=535722 RepID=E4UX95_ARTGP|nr:carbonyl reductase 1 [Nannizzia gypsea CBS 118893]EFR02682.1 carbonyl reductase 1 [Nannizzia gypsea CBS 118893]
MESPVVAVVTGANRGIGLAICTVLAQTFSSPLILYTASRSGGSLDLRGVSKSRSVDLRPIRLSLTDTASITALKATVESECNGCDILINNAGLYYYRTTISAAERRETLDVNYRGTLKLCEAFIPIMRSNGRIVNLSSQSGRMLYFSQGLQERFLDPSLTLDKLDSLIQEYEQAAASGKAEKMGWPALAYFTSKAAVNATTRILASENPHLLINCCCPGWVATDLGAQAGPPPKTTIDGAKIPLRLAFGNIGGVSGRYWANDSVGGSGDGEIQEW